MMVICVSVKRINSVFYLPQNRYDFYFKLDIKRNIISFK